MDPRNYRNMDTGNDARVHTRDNLVVNQSHRMNSNNRLHWCEFRYGIDLY
jgi:hypothetical protein